METFWHIFVLLFIMANPHYQKLFWVPSVCIQIDGSDKKKKKNSGGFQVGKRKVKTKLSALAKAKAAQAMEVDK